MAPRRAFWLLAVLGVLTAGVACAAEPRSPEPGSDGRVTFRYVWPRDARVELVGRSADKGHDFPENTYDLKRNAEGVWEITLGPLLPGSTSIAIASMAWSASIR